MTDEIEKIIQELEAYGVKASIEGSVIRFKIAHGQFTEKEEIQITNYIRKAVALLYPKAKFDVVFNNK